MENPNMGLGMMPPNTNSMQRPQQGNIQQQPHARIMEELKKSLPTLPDDWRKIMDIRHRASWVMQLISQLKILMSNSADITKALSIAINFENTSIRQATSREHYDQMLQGKLDDVRKKREQQAMQMRQQGQANMNANVGMGQPGMPNMNGMGMNMQGGGNMMMPNAQMNMNMGGNAGQPNPAFPAHLQRQMQPSPMPQQPGTMDPSALQNATPQSRMLTAGQQNLQQGQMNLQQGGQGAQQMPNNSQQALMMRAREVYNSMTEESRNTFRSRLHHTLSPQEQELDKQHGRDPLFRMLMKRLSQQSRQAMLRQNGGNMQMGNQQGVMGGIMPQQNGGPPNFDFITGQQANALKQQESGELVVPASNNATMGASNQMNMGAQNSINPQMLAGGNNQQPGNPQFQRQINDLMQQQKAAQAAQVAHQRNLVAQQQAQQHGNQLRGQPGGLNAPNALNGGPAGQTHSPAMSMLNRPMVPPGQAAPGTPNQQNRPPTQPPQTPGNAATQNLMQHYQQMTNQNGGQMNQPNQGQTSFDPVKRRQELSEITEGMAPQIRQMVISRMMEPMQARILVQQRKQAMQQQGMPNGLQNQQAGLPPNMQNMGQAQTGGQSTMFGGALGQGIPGNSVPNFNSQPPPNQQPLNQSNMDSVHLQQKLQQQQQVMMSRALDMRPFNRALLTPLNLNVPVPGEVNTWGRLKQWAQSATQQGIVPPDAVQRIGQLQQQYFANNRPEMEQARADLMRTLAMKKQQQAAMQSGQQRPPTGGPTNMPGMGVQNGGQAPPAQMVPPAAPIQQAGHQGAQGLNQGQRPAGPIQPPQMPTIEEVHKLRASQQNGISGTDDQVRAMLFDLRKKQYAAQMQQVQEGLRNAQTGGRQGQPPQGTQVRPQPTPQPGQKRAAQPQPQSASSDDVMEIPNPNAPQAPPQAPQQPPQMDVLQAPAMQANGSQRQRVPPIPPGLPPQFHQQWAHMTNENRKGLMTKLAQMRRVQAMNTGQQGPPQQAPQQEGTQQQSPSGPVAGQQSQIQQWQVQTSALYAQVERENPKGPPVQVPDPNSQQGQQYLGAWKRLWIGIIKVQQTWPAVLAQYPNLQQYVKMMMKVKVQMLQNVTDPNATVNGYFSITPQQVFAYVQLMQKYTMELKKAKGGVDAAGAVNNNEQAKAEPQQGQDQPTKQRTASMAGAKGQQGTLASAGGQMGKMPSQPSHNRKASSSKVPAAPTENKTFDWGVTSPHGVPKYDSGRKEITPDSLKMPVSKKRKVTGSAASTPGAQTGTPAPTSQSPSLMAKSSPEAQGKKSSQQVKLEADAANREEQARMTFKCADALCEASIRGFATEAELQKHNESEHQSVDDPLRYLLESAAGFLGSENGPAAMQAKPQPQSKSVPAAVKLDATSAPIGTSKQIGTRPIPTSMPIDLSKPREKTLRDAMEEKMGFEPFIMPNEEIVQDFPMSATTAGAEHDESFNGMIAASLGDLSDVDLGLNVANNFDSTAYNLRPGELDPVTDPELTPSDGTSSQSSRESDVSQSELLKINLEWDSFGDFDTQIPEGLGIYGQLESLGGLGLEGSPEVSRDVGMGGMGDDANKEKEGADEWNWSGDQGGADFDAIFGPNAGLEEAGLVF